MKQSKYSIPNSWINKINEDTDMWHGIFENIPLNRDSVIVTPTIFNSYINQAESGWVIYPDVYSVLGFLTYMYLPTVRKSLISRSEDYRYEYSFDFEELLEQDKETYPEKVQQILKLKTFYGQLQELCKKGAQHCYNQLKELSIAFNQNWEDEKFISHLFTIFKSPKEVAQYLIDIYEEDLSIEMLEDDFELIKDELLNLTSDDIYDNEFLKRKFTDNLANKLNVTL